MPKKKTHGVDESMKGLLVPIAKLNLDPRNARKHDERNLDAVAKSMAEFGQDQPLVVQKQGMVVRKGNARLAAARKLGWTHVAAVVVDESDVRAMARAIADNRTAELAEWDDKILAESLAELQRVVDFDHEVAGFTDGEIDQLVAKACGVEVVEDEMPEPPKKAVTKPGDLWLLGEHRVLCGDAAKAEDVGRVMDSRKADCVFTDPPYGVGYTGGAKPRDALVNDRAGTTIYADALPNLREAAADHAALYLWYADAHAAAAAAAAAGYDIVAQVIWVKNNAQFVSAAKYHGKHEPCFYAHRRGKSARWVGGKNEVTVWECDRAHKNTYHPTQKPVALAARALGNSTNPDDIVLDLFLGSGTTLIAAEQLGRKCYGLEIEPRYCDVIVERWEKLTGKKAKRQPCKA